MEFTRTSIVSQNVSLLCTIEAPSGLSQENRAPISASLVLDRSGSMAGDPIYLLKESAKYFIDILEQGDSLGIISYSSSVIIKFPFYSKINFCNLKIIL